MSSFTGGSRSCRFSLVLRELPALTPDASSFRRVCFREVHECVGGSLCSQGELIFGAPTVQTSNTLRCVHCSASASTPLLRAILVPPCFFRRASCCVCLKAMPLFMIRPFFCSVPCVNLLFRRFRGGSAANATSCGRGSLHQRRRPTGWWRQTTCRPSSRWSRGRWRRLSCRRRWTLSCRSPSDFCW